MFLIAYILIVGAAAVPLIRAGLRARSEGWSPPSVHQAWHASYYLIAAIVAIYVLEEWVFPIAADSLWFGELHQSARFWTVLGYQAGIFAVVWTVLFLFIGYNLWLMIETPEVTHIPPAAAWLVGFLVALVAAGISVGAWQQIVAYLGARPSGVTDSILGKDVSFYLFSLPLYTTLVLAALAALLLLVVAWCAVTALYNTYGPLRRDSRRYDQERGHDPGTTAEIAAAVWTRWARQGGVLTGLLLIVYGLKWELARYGLVVHGTSSVVPGASYIDVEWNMTICVIVAWTLFGAGAFCLMAAFTASFQRALVDCFRDGKPWQPVVVAISAFAVVRILVIPAIPGIVHYMRVRPNEITFERPYLTNGINGTREAFNITSKTIAQRTFDVSPTSLTQADLNTHANILRDARIWDWGALQKQFEQDQGLRAYYRFNGIDIDRYPIDGVERQIMLSAREMDISLLPSQSQVWVNSRIKYTHGYGIAAVPVNERDSSGSNPVLWSHDIPVVAKPALTVKNPQIYFGELTNEAVYVNTSEKEFDFPKGDENAETVYNGTGGIVLSNFWRKLVFAHELDGLKLFLSDYFTSGSKVLWRRQIQERISILAPFLSLDKDPYIVAGEDQYYWINDAYTTSDRYPYSEPYAGSISQFSGINYIRNSVKVVVGSYDGSVTFYVFDPSDPIVKAYRRMLPGLFKDASEMPALLRQHVRYPEGYFTVQAEMFERFHMTDPVTFFNSEDLWDTPNELYYGAEQRMQPYYVTTELSELHGPQFMLMLPFAVHKKNQMAGWLAGLSDGDNYGKLIAYTLPKGVFVDGPAQIEARISSQQEMSEKLTLWDQHGSKVIRGNLLVLPLGNALVTFEPVYIESEATKIPQLTRVIFGQLMPNNLHIVWASTLPEAQEVLIGAIEERLTHPIAGPVSVAGLEHLRQVFQDMKDAFTKGDFVTYGKKLQELQEALGMK